MHKLFDTVVIGTSLRPEAEHHVRTAVAFARAGGARIELVHALEPRDVIAPGMEWLPQELWDELRADLQKDLEAQARRDVHADRTTPYEMVQRALIRETGPPYQALHLNRARVHVLSRRDHGGKKQNQCCATQSVHDAR